MFAGAGASSAQAMAGTMTAATMPSVPAPAQLAPAFRLYRAGACRITVSIAIPFFLASSRTLPHSARLRQFVDQIEALRRIQALSSGSLAIPVGRSTFRWMRAGTRRAPYGPKSIHLQASRESTLARSRAWIHRGRSISCLYASS